MFKINLTVKDSNNKAFENFLQKNWNSSNIQIRIENLILGVNGPQTVVNLCWTLLDMLHTVTQNMSRQESPLA